MALVMTQVNPSTILQMLDASIREHPGNTYYLDNSNICIKLLVKCAELKPNAISRSIRGKIIVGANGETIQIFCQKVYELYSINDITTFLRKN
jgi:hypothetical protein